MNVAAEIVEQMLGRAERLFSMDDPGFLPQCVDQELKGCRIGQGGGFSWEDKLLLIERLLDKVEELTTEDDAEGFDTEEEVFTGGDPVVLIEGQSPLGDQAAKVEMIQEDLVPGMKHGGKAQGASKMSAGEV